MKIYFMKQKALDSLQAEVADNLNKYQSSSFWMDEHFINQNMPKYYFDTGIEVADYQLISGGPETDFQNAKIVFEAFKNKLNPVQASDLRLWAYLAHVQHPRIVSLKVSILCFLSDSKFLIFIIIFLSYYFSNEPNISTLILLLGENELIRCFIPTFTVFLIFLIE